ncbi:hypothetical protein B0H14DRAFT_3166500 [Mycena olivaceomarginata]|nr:hypothetical protein B0H14DRAFT_3166500 [Mycena olivaceomarginata]
MSWCYVLCVELLSVCSLDLGLALCVRCSLSFQLNHRMSFPSNSTYRNLKKLTRSTLNQSAAHAQTNSRGYSRTRMPPSGEDRWQNDDAAADADTILLHSHLGPRVQRTENEALHVRPNPPAPGVDGVGVGKYCTSKRSTDDLLARAALGAGLTQLKDVNAADLAQRSTASQSAQGDALPGCGACRGAGYARRVRWIPRQREWGAPAYRAQGDTPRRSCSSPPPPRMRTYTFKHTQKTTRTQQRTSTGWPTRAWQPRGGGPHSQSRSSGRSSGSGSRRVVFACGRNRAPRHARPKKSKSKRTTESKSSATSSTLASPPPTSASFPHGVCDSGVYADPPTELGAFTSGTRGVEDDFDGTPGGFSTFNDEAAKGKRRRRW